MSDITVQPHTIRRTIPAYRSRYEGWIDKRIFDEVDIDFPFLARCGSVSAIGRTREGAVAMVEAILAAAPRAGAD